MTASSFEVIPAVDVLDGRVVRLQRGDYEQVTVYGDDPVAQAVQFIGEGASRVHVVDLAGARDGSHATELWSSLGEAGVEFQVGGGIRSAATAEAAIAAGAGRVVVGTAAVWEPQALGDITRAVGPEQVVIAVDVREGKATGAGWRDGGRELDTVLDQVQAAGAIRALVTGIARDGTMAGPDIELLRQTIALAPDLRIIASGGVGTLADLAELVALDVEGAIVGRAVYEGVFSVPEAIAVTGR